MMVWLHSSNAQMDYVLYASQVVFELIFNQECVDSTESSEACFRVDVRWNGKDLAFEKCAGSADQNGTGCSYTDFKTLMKSLWYDGDLKEDCLEV